MRPDNEGFDVQSPLVRRRDYSRDGILRSLEESLERLRLDRVIASYGAGMNQSAMLADFVLNTDELASRWPANPFFSSGRRTGSVAHWRTGGRLGMAPG